ncbi:MAG TPA: beta-Ala-His dipeptidase [Rectinemataceae bacterium]|nr:beta-Ala-His dipeptidase [Rectinemataceae bacterium]
MVKCLEGIEPRRVLEIFSDLCSIPHGSKNEKAISDHVRDFCIARGLQTYQDEANNVIIQKPATPGYEGLPTVVLQAHLDMVCEKNASSTHDFTRDPIRVMRDGDRIYADGTTLGADDATGVAFALCVLESKDIPHPALEVVLTVDEEAGMGGIKALDFGRLSGHIVINLDCSDEGIVVGCSGVAEAQISLPMKPQPLSEAWTRKAIKIRGLKGGHSGLDIAKERGNANLLMARVIADLRKTCDVRMCSFDGGEHTNAIVRECDAAIAFEKRWSDDLSQKIDEWLAMLRKEFKVSDPGISLTIEDQALPVNAFSGADTERILDTLLLLSSGVVTMSMEVGGLPETSGNIGSVATVDQGIVVKALYRSGLDSKKQFLLDRCARVARLVGGKYSINSSSPEWEYKADSRLASLIKKLFRVTYGAEIVVEVSHGGNECGMFFRNIPGADIVCAGTRIIGAHTPEESVQVSAIQKEWNMLCLTLEHMAEY